MSAPQSRVPLVSRRGSAALDAVAVAFVVVAFLYGRSVTADLEWPGDPDMFRDLAVAQSMHDCRCAADPHYRGELLWYNPLTSGVVAAIAAVTGRPVNLVQVRDGVFLNLLAPFGFYVLAVVLAGRLAAVPALVAFLFLGPGQLFDTATYSPWLMSPNFAQGFFYLGLAAYLHAVERRHAGWWIAAGVPRRRDGARPHRGGGAARRRRRCRSGGRVDALRVAPARRRARPADGGGGGTRRGALPLHRGVALPGSGAESDPDGVDRSLDGARARVRVSPGAPAAAGDGAGRDRVRRHDGGRARVAPAPGAGGVVGHLRALSRLLRTCGSGNGPRA